MYTIKSAKTFNYKAWFSHAAATACDVTPTDEDITAPAQETSQVFTAGMPEKSNSVNFAGMTAVKTDVTSAVAGDFCTHIGTVLQKVVAAMSASCRR